MSSFNIKCEAKEMTIEIPFKTPSVNKLYATVRGYRVKSKEARQLEGEIALLLHGIQTDLEGGELEVELSVHENWYNKNGTIKKKDVVNREKFLIDAVFKALRLDDSQIFKMTITKQDSKDEFSFITIRLCERN